jgi:LAS superfamily LD-carboxypeptidase LdcB
MSHSISSEGVFLPEASQLLKLDAPSCLIQRDAAQPFLLLCSAASDAGFEIAVASSYRSVERQCLIWNEKLAGVRPVLDLQGNPLDISRMNEYDTVTAVLRWSALPGTSRHHWGTDLDIYDRAAVPTDYRVQLTCDECENNGPFATFHAWFDQRLADGKAFGFYRPYAVDRGGVAPEPWHISYAPLAARFSRQLNKDALRAVVAALDIGAKATVLANFDEIYQRFVVVDVPEGIQV